MTTSTPAGGAAAAPAASGTAAAASGAAPSSGAAGAAAPAAGATPDASAAAAGAASSAASAAGEGGKPGAAAKPALKGGFLDGPAAGAEGDAPAGEVDAARLEAFAKVEGADARLEAWGKLNDAEKAKLAEGMSEEDRKALGIEAKPPAAGEITYTDFKVPEGIAVDKGLMDKAVERFKAQGLNQEQAQSMVDFYAGDVAELVKAEASKPYDLWRDTQNEWIETVHADPELGGAKNQAARANAARAIDTLMSKDEAAEVRAALSFTGATNNPAIFRLLARAGAKISEGRYVGGNPPAPAPKTAAEVMYPTTVKAAE